MTTQIFSVVTVVGISREDEPGFVPRNAGTAFGIVGTGGLSVGPHSSGTIGRVKNAEPDIGLRSAGSWKGIILSRSPMAATNSISIMCERCVWSVIKL